MLSRFIFTLSDVLPGRINGIPISRAKMVVTRKKMRSRKAMSDIEAAENSVVGRDLACSFFIAAPRSGYDSPYACA
jgi:hypothetical protein